MNIDQKEVLYSIRKVMAREEFDALLDDEEKEKFEAILQEVETKYKEI